MYLFGQYCIFSFQLAVEPVCEFETLVKEILRGSQKELIPDTAKKIKTDKRFPKFQHCCLSQTESTHLKACHDT